MGDETNMIYRQAATGYTGMVTLETEAICKATLYTW